MKHFFYLLLATTLVFTACSKDDEEEPVIVNPELKQGEVTIGATAYENWIYFSFEEESIVEVTDAYNSTNWDIGFHRFDVKVNCGTAGVGKGGSYNAGKIDFDKAIEAPENGYSLNDSIGVILESGVWEYTMVPGDTIVSSWLTFSGPPPTYTISDNIYYLKTAKGNYAKIWLKDYYNDLSQPGYITMEYIMQPDGSRKLE